MNAGSLIGTVIYGRRVTDHLPVFPFVGVTFAWLTYCRIIVQLNVEIYTFTFTDTLITHKHITLHISHTPTVHMSLEYPNSPYLWHVNVLKE